MSGNAEAIVIGANGSVSVAPLGTPLPETIDDTLNAAFLDTGYLSEDGVKQTDGRTVEGIKVWQSLYEVRRFVTAKEFMIAFVMREWNRVTLPLAYGGGTITESPADSGFFRYDPPPPEQIDERAMVIDWVDGERRSRVVIARGNVSENVESTIARSGPADLPITFNALGEDGELPWYFLSDDPIFADA